MLLEKEGLYHKLQRIKRQSGEPFITVYLEGVVDDGDYKRTKATYVLDEFNTLLSELSNILTNYSDSEQLEDYAKLNPNTLLDIPLTVWGDFASTLESLEVTYTDETGLIWDVEIKKCEELFPCECCDYRGLPETMKVDEYGAYTCKDCE